MSDKISAPTITAVKLQPAPGRRVRLENGSRPLKAEGELVQLTSYWRRRLKAGDVIDITTPESELVVALRSLDPANPAHFTENGQPDLTYLTELLNRKVTKKEVEAAMQDITSGQKDA